MADQWRTSYEVKRFVFRADWEQKDPVKGDNEGRLFVSAGDLTRAVSKVNGWVKEQNAMDGALPKSITGVSVEGELI
jgi:hypothetical protein